MKNSIRKAFVIFKYTFLVFTIAFWIYTIIEEYERIKEYGAESILYLVYYYVAYLIAISMYFWVISFVGILVYHKLIKKHRSTRHYL